MKLRNFTPHRVIVYAENALARFESEGIARVVGKSRRVNWLEKELGYPCVRKIYTQIQGLPEPEPDTMYIVSLIVLQAAKNRSDIICPDTGPESCVRAADGTIMGIRRFQAN